MSGSRHDWPDDETAERLLRGEPVDAENTGTDEFDADTAQESRDPRDLNLAALLSAAAGSGLPLEPDREDAALAAFRQAHQAVARDAEAMVTAAWAAGPAADGLRDGGRRVIDARERFGRARGWPGSAKVAVTAVFAATVLAGGVAAAAVGVLPSPFPASGTSPRPDGSHRPAPLPPQMTEPAGSQSGTPTYDTRAPQRPPGPNPSPDTAGDGTDIPGAFGAAALRGLCAEYLGAENGHGKGPGSGYQKWLDGQAGGARFVGVFCRRHLDPAAQGQPAGVSPSPSVPGSDDGGFGSQQCGPPSTTPTQPPFPSVSAAGSTPGAPGPTAGGSPSPSPSDPPAGSATSSPAPSASQLPSPSETSQVGTCSTVAPGA